MCQVGSSSRGPDKSRVSLVRRLASLLRSCRVVPRHVILCRAVSCRVASCRVVSCRVVSCRLSFDVMSCYVVSGLFMSRVVDFFVDLGR